jgi:FlaA1/EpsC-like NDP-sugar epimerase
MKTMPEMAEKRKPVEIRSSLKKSAWSQSPWMRISGHKLLASAKVLANHTSPSLVKTAVDLILIVVAAAWTWFVAFSQMPSPPNPLPSIGVVVLGRLFVYRLLELYKMSWTHVSRHDALWLVLSAILGAPVIALLFRVLPAPFSMSGVTRPHLILLTEAAFYTLLLGGARIATRALEEGRWRVRRGQRRLLIIGAGSAGRSLAFQLQETASQEYYVVGFVDDDALKQHRKMRGVPILGSLEELPAIARDYDVQEVIIAIPSLTPERLRQCLSACQAIQLPVRILPPLNQIIGKASFTALREVQMEDLLPRPEVKLDRAAIASYVVGRTVLVTGGGGSIGGELCRQVLDAGATRLLVLGRGENSVFEMAQELNERCKALYANASALEPNGHAGQNGHSGASLSIEKLPCEIVPIICDVRDRAALTRVFERFKPQVIFHAAAHKHVPLMEAYPCEAVKNNVIGTLHLVQLACEYGFERFVMVSTDKAVNPTNIMGASKRIGEMIVKGYAAATGANMVCVRFGNVLGSRGSVVRTMQSQIRRRLPVTVTDPEMVRFFMTIPEAVQLVLQAGAEGGCGEVFVLDMGHPVKILDLAYDLIRLSGLVPEQDIPIKIIGKRPGEKMHEELLTKKETEGASKKGPFFVAPPQAVDLASLLRSITVLQEAAETGEAQRVVSLVQELVPAYKPS